jgi:hypothetical protein
MSYALCLIELVELLQEFFGTIFYFIAKLLRYHILLVFVCLENERYHVWFFIVQPTTIFCAHMVSSGLSHANQQ